MGICSCTKNAYYSQECTPVSAPIRGNARQTSEDMFRENQEYNLQTQETKTKPFTFQTCPDICVDPS